MLSLTSRLSISLTLVLAGFFGVTGYVLNKTFQETIKEATEDRLRGYAMALIAAAEIRFDGHVSIPETLPITRLNLIYSGLYAQVVNDKGDILWQSSSANEQTLPLVEPLYNLEAMFSINILPSGDSLFSFRYGMSWNKEQAYTINILESLDAYTNQTKKFQEKLWVWLGGASLVLLIVQALLMRLSLSPLRKAALEIEKIKRGEQSELKNTYPSELRALTKNLNGLIKSNKQHLSRYRNSLADLAHSLKTPLALLRSAGESNDPKFPLDKVVSEQVDHMRKIVDYQLQRASTSGHNPLSKPVNIKTICEKINNSLAKVYADKSLQATLKIENDHLFFGDESDLYELLGNTMDNAYQWAHAQINITIFTPENSVSTLFVCIEDDGPGMETSFAKKALERGIRSDEREGTGIGLAMVNDIVQAYNGTITIEQSHLGGCKLTIRLPQNQ